jgi:hypothetical protein
MAKPEESAKKKLPWWVWLVGGVLVLGGIGSVVGGDDTGSSTTAEQVPGETLVTEEPAAVDEPAETTLDCLPVADSLIAAIQDGVDDVEASNTISRAAAVKAPERENVWFIAAEILGDGIEPGQAIGVWGTNRGADDSESGLLFSVDGFAKEFSSWGSTEGTDFEISGAEAGIKEAKACLG